jgi:hypothetical protein
MDRETFDRYIGMFNRQDPHAFDEFIAVDMTMLNGGLHIHGREGMRAHYAQIWRSCRETLNVERFVSDDETLAIQMWAHFDVDRDDSESVFGPVRAGEAFDFRGLIMYRIGDGQFVDCKVAYNSFSRTDSAGVVLELGMPH